MQSKPTIQSAEVEYMVDEERHEPRPLWVRLVMREEMKRSAALVLASIFGLLTFCIALADTLIWSSGSYFLGSLALPLGLVSACLGAAGALWCWLALRWVDRNGKWA
jgi:hypothetical protein